MYKIFIKNILSFIFIIITCSTYAQNKVEYIVYGTYYGECWGHCSLMFKLDNSKLLVDTTRSFFKNWEKTVTFKNDTASQKDFLDAKEILQTIPTLLFISTSKSFGDPDGYDQGGIFVQLKINKKIKRFYIDRAGDKTPPALRNFAELIDKKVNSKWTYYYR